MIVLTDMWQHKPTPNQPLYFKEHTNYSTFHNYPSAPSKGWGWLVKTHITHILTTMTMLSHVVSGSNMYWYASYFFISTAKIRDYHFLVSIFIPVNKSINPFNPKH